jgi:hypothetical protein
LVGSAGPGGGGLFLTLMPTGKTAHRKRRTDKAEEVVLDTRHAQAHFFCANGVLSGSRRWGTYATLH